MRMDSVKIKSHAIEPLKDIEEMFICFWNALDDEYFTYANQSKDTAHYYNLLKVNFDAAAMYAKKCFRLIHEDEDFEFNE